MKLTVLGGGGVRSPWLARSIMNLADDLGFTEICFMDNDRDKLRIFGGLAQHIAEVIEPGIKFVLTTDAREALTDARYIITTLRVGGDHGRTLDESIALSHQVIGQETTGAGGFAMAMRSIPALFKYFELAREMAHPEHLIFNFTNPAGLVAQAAQYAGYDNVYGICDGPIGLFKQINTVLETDMDHVDVTVYGLNHLSYFSSYKVDGEEMVPTILEDPRMREHTDLRMFDPQQLQDYGVLFNEYLYYFYSRDEALAHILEAPRTRGETIEQINLRMMERMEGLDIEHDLDAIIEIFLDAYYEREDSYMSIESGGFRDPLPRSKTFDYGTKGQDDGGYAGVALGIIRGLESEEARQAIVNVPNSGALPGLRDDDVVEASCRVSRDGVIPRPIEAIPELQLRLIQTVKNYERLAAQAILDRDANKAVLALSVHPLIQSYSLAKTLVREYQEAHREYIGEWS